MPAWVQVIIAVFGGGFAKAVIDLFRDRERHVWAELRRVNEENKGLREQLAACEKLKGD